MINGLAQVLAPPVRGESELPDIGFHQGVIIAWDDETGENTVSTQGTQLTNISMLNIGDTTNLARGDVVLIFRLRTQYFIVGRIVAPNGGIFASSSVDFDSRNEFASGHVLNTTETIRVTATLTVPPWANEALIYTTGLFSGLNSSGGADAIYGAVWVDSFNGNQMLNSVVAGTTGFVSAVLAREQSVTPGGTVTVTGRVKTAFNTWAASANNVAQLMIAAIYRKTT